MSFGIRNCCWRYHHGGHHFRSFPTIFVLSNCGDASDELGCYGEDKDDAWFRHPAAILSLAAAGAFLLLLAVTWAVLHGRVRAGAGRQFEHRRMEEEEAPEGTGVRSVQLAAPLSESSGDRKGADAFRAFNFSLELRQAAGGDAVEGTIPNAFDNPGFIQDHLEQLHSRREQNVGTLATRGNHDDGSRVVEVGKSDMTSSIYHLTPTSTVRPSDV